MKFQAIAALVVVGIAAITDLRSRRVPNILTLTAAVVAFAFHGFSSGWPALVMSLGGWVVGLMLFMPLFLLRGIGGGDVKLLAAIGAWLGPIPTIWVALFAALAGGVLAVIVSAYHGYTRQAFTNVWGLLSYWRIMGIRPHPALTLESSKSPRLPYAVPMAAGLGLALWLK